MRIVLFTILCTFSAMSSSVQASNYVCLYTNVNEICMRMLSDDAPGTVENFLNYVNSGAYNGTVIHRSVPGFIVQGGGFYRDPLGNALSTNAPIANEFKLSNTRARVAMAKLGGDPDSATSQWFVNLGDNAANLDNQNGGFTVFAEVFRGMEVVDGIAALQRYNLTNSANGAFGETPGIPVSETDIVLITVLRAQAFETLPIDSYSCTETGKGTNLAEFCGGTALTMPVRLGSKLYEVSLQLSSSSPKHELTLVPGSIKRIEDFGQPAATFTSATGELFMSSLKVGAKSYRNMKWQRTGSSGFVFTLTSINK